MKIKKICLLVSLCMAVSIFSSTFALASDSAATSGIDPAYEGPEIVVEVPAIANQNEALLPTSGINPAYDGPEIAIGGEFAEDEEDTLTRDGRSVNTSVNFSLNSGVSWSKSFNMGNGSSPSHNAFNVVVSNFSGNQYRIIIEGNQGYSFADSLRSGDSWVRVTNARPNETYTARVVNTNTGRITGTVQVSSYYN